MNLRPICVSAFRLWVCSVMVGHTAVAHAQSTPAPATQGQHKTPVPTPKDPAPTSQEWAGGVPLLGVRQHVDEDIYPVLHWAQTTEVSLWATPGPAAKAMGRFAVKKGKNITFDKDYIWVTDPLIYEAKADTQLRNARTLDPTTLKSVGPALDIAIRKGERVYLLDYGGEGEVTLWVNGTLYGYSIPLDGFRCLGDENAEIGHRWWVRTKTPIGTGWIEVEKKTVTLESKGPNSH